MPSFFWIVFGLFMTGGVSFSIGVILGRFSGWNHVSAALTSGEQDPQLLRFAQRLNQMIRQLSKDVGRHRSNLEASTSELNARREQPAQDIAEFVLSVVGKVLESNESLQKRLHAAESKLREQGTQLDTYLTKSQTDSLTRLPNRRVFDEQLRKYIDAHVYHRTSFALLMLDLDHFKAVNDGFGHLGGDYVLRELAAALMTFSSENLFLARLGGEEFAAIMCCQSVEDAFGVAEQIRTAVEARYFSYDGVALAVTLSVGVALHRDGESSSDLLGRTDRALYAAKAAGRNCSFYHDGKRCLPINVPQAPRDDSKEILGLCDELRQRMAEIVSD
jgi:diguanylate cyclase